MSEFYGPIGWSTPLNKWMSRIGDGMNLSMMTILGTHNSCAFHEKAGIGRCQHYSLTTQLNMGVRYLDIRCCVSGGVFLIHHGSIYEEMNFDDVMSECLGFLAAYPSETIFMRIKQEYSTVSNPEFMSIFNGRYQHYQRSMLFLDTCHGPGTMGKARGKITIISNLATLPGIQWGEIIKQDVDNQSDPRKKWDLVKQQLDMAASAYKMDDLRFYLNGLNAHDGKDASDTNVYIAAAMRAQLMAYVIGKQSQQYPAVEFYGVLATDFIDLYAEDDMKKIIYCNNGDRSSYSLKG
ncbi:phosphatidylinositol-specific phospholipase C domain-containing protein [Pseudomonas sp. PDM25]|uniref:phosphatidylinositol-specific phospholipase C domain-containing protein n=1 Tax=Pseudomonas sp. PDM25 TaxID=2854772 RepID=UPI001C43C92A|nr:phosphatidylinositol-specific phospholipase C domain-containing protein [Pseudomonas sp. PDM25]MBV7515679.1 phosphatidylinositol-specific phospholipase C domain-containing protein [Pseudomonas sp. PDM25]